MRQAWGLVLGPGRGRRDDGGRKGRGERGEK